MKNNKKAVMYGAGNIGRGFIAQLFYMSGYETVFIDVNEEVIDSINKDGEYPIFITTNDKYDEFTVKNVRAVNGRNINEVAEEISTADIMATAVGVNVLNYIVKPIAAGIKLRFENNGKPLNIIICENKINVDKYLSGLLINEFAAQAEKDYFTENIGLVEPSIGRMVPVTPDDIKAQFPLAVCVESYNELPVDKSGFKGEIPDIKNMKPYAPFEYYIQRKLFLHNMCHALVSYLGYLKGYKYIWEAVGDAEIRYKALGALIESSCALNKEHKADIYSLILASYDLLNRFDNKLLGDTIDRVGKDTKRKLSEDDRIVGAVKLCLKHDINPDNILNGLAAGLLFKPENDDNSIEVYNFTKTHGVKESLKRYCGIDEVNICEKIENIYKTL